MDLTFSKRLTQRFLRECASNSKKFFEEFSSVIHNPRVKNQNRKKNWLRFIQFMKGPNNIYTLNNAEFGSKVKPLMGLSLLHVGDYNPFEKRDEYMIYIQDYILSFDPPDINKSGISVTLSHHVIQRIFQRHPKFKIENYQKSFFIIKKDLKYLNFMSFILKSFFIYISKERKDNFEYNKYLNYMVPCGKGALLGQKDFFDGNVGIHSGLNIRTYFNEEKLTKNQKQFIRNFQESFDPYFSCQLPFLFSYMGEKKNKIYEELSFLMMGFIFIEITPILEASFSSLYKKNTPSKIQNKIKESMKEYLKDFPQYLLSSVFNDPKQYIDFKNAVKEDKILEWLRKTQIRIHQGNL